MLEKDEKGLIRINATDDRSNYQPKSYELKVSKDYLGLDSTFERDLSFKKNEQEKEEEIERKLASFTERGIPKTREYVESIVGEYKNLTVNAYLKYQLNAEKHSIVTRFPVKKTVRICMNTGKKAKWKKKVQIVGQELANFINCYHPYSNDTLEYQKLSFVEKIRRRKENEKVYELRNTLKEFCSNFFGKDFDTYYSFQKENQENPFYDLTRINAFFTDYESYFEVSKLADKMKPSVKKTVSRGYGALQVYKLALKIGIKEINKQLKFIENFADIAYCNRIRTFEHLLKNLIKLHGETAAIKKLTDFKAKREYELYDLLTSVQRWKYFSKEEYNAADFKGTMLDIHDRFALKYRDARGTFFNSPIEYSEKEKGYEYKEGNFEFCIPAETKKLVEIGDRMNICVGNYGGRAIQKQCTIVYVKKAGHLEACIELRNYKNGNPIKTSSDEGTMSIVQCKGYRNQLFNKDEDTYQIVMKWANANAISRVCYDLGTN